MLAALLPQMLAFLEAVLLHNLMWSCTINVSNVARPTWRLCFLDTEGRIGTLEDYNQRPGTPS
jgi:hypothetical protein